MFIRAVFKVDINDSVIAFKINDVSYGHFLNFLVLAGQKKVEDAILALNEQPDVQGIADMPEFVTDRQNIPQADVDRQNSLKAALDSMSVGRAALVSKNGNTYNIAKLLGKSVQSDNQYAYAVWADDFSDVDQYLHDSCHSGMSG